MKCFKGFKSSGDFNLETNPAAGWSQIGSFGTGLYFGDLKCAEVYKEEHPDDGCLYTLETDGLKVLTINTGDEIIEQYQIDTYALPLISNAFDVSLDEASLIFEKLVLDYFYLGEEIQNALLRKGYQAIHVIYNEQPEVFEFVVIDPTVPLKIEIFTQTNERVEHLSNDTKIGYNEGLRLT